jgi:hypothetical protein
MLTVSEVINKIFSPGSPLTSISYAGTMNIESGEAEVRTEYFGPCSQCENQLTVVKICSECGRADGNNVSFRSGRGDGVYSGLSLMAGNQLLGTVFVFDENNQFAANSAAELARCEKLRSLNDNQFQGLLFTALADFASLKAFDAGMIDSIGSNWFEKCFLISDYAAGVDSDFAAIDNPFGNSRYGVVLFMEPLASLSASDQVFIQLGGQIEELTGGHDGAMRPRVLMVLREDFISTEIPALGALDSFDWASSVSAWNNSLVYSNLGGKNNLSAIYNNGIFWSLAARAQPQDTEVNKGLWYFYATRAFGWFAQGALLGDEDALVRMLDSVNDSTNAEILDPQVLSDALDARGWNASAEVVEKVTRIWRQGTT